MDQRYEWDDFVRESELFNSLWRAKSKSKDAKKHLAFKFETKLFMQNLKLKSRAQEAYRGSLELSERKET